MPKQVHKIEQFHGGINSSSDPRDILDNESTALVDAMVDEVGTIRTIGSNIPQSDVSTDKLLDNIAALTGVPGAGLFVFKHDRLGAEDAGSNEAETGDNYIAFYADDDPNIWIYSLATDDWNTGIDFLGKTTSDAARPVFTSIDGALRISSGEHSKYDSGSNVVGAFSSSKAGLGVTNSAHFQAGNYIQIEDEVIYIVSTSTYTGNHTGGGDEDVLANSGGGFTADFFIGGILTNTTDGSSATITDNDGTTITANLSGGTDNDWDNGDAYTITHLLEVRRGMFGTKSVAHSDTTDIYILNMNQWYGYINSKFFQTSAGVAEYAPSKWVNSIQHLRSLDELGITLVLDDSSAASPHADDLVEKKVIISYWLADNGFWSGAYWLGLTPVYLGGSEGPLSTVGSEALQINEQILNVQMHICHPDIDSATIATHPLGDDRIIGLNLYVKAFTSNEWFLLKKFDLLEGGEHGWAEYDGTVATGFWTDGTVSGQTSGVAAYLVDPASLDSYERTTAVVNVKPGTAMGSGRKGIARVTGFQVSPVYASINLNSTSQQNTTLNVVNPGPGDQKTFVIDVLDENYDVLYTTQVEKDIADSGAAEPTISTSGGYGGSS